MHHNHREMKDCIELCWKCRNECQDTLFNHCLKAGGDHLEPEHVRLMADCIQICQASADSMTRHSPLHASICAACANICEACAKSCEKIGGDHMKVCAEACRECAKACREMGKMKKAA